MAQDQASSNRGPTALAPALDHDAKPDIGSGSRMHGKPADIYPQPGECWIPVLLPPPVAPSETLSPPPRQPEKRVVSKWFAGKAGGLACAGRCPFVLSLARFSGSWCALKVTSLSSYINQRLGDTGAGDVFDCAIGGQERLGSNSWVTFTSRRTCVRSRRGGQGHARTAPSRGRTAGRFRHSADRRRWPASAGW